MTTYRSCQRAHNLTKCKDSFFGKQNLKMRLFRTMCGLLNQSRFKTIILPLNRMCSSSEKITNNNDIQSELNKMIPTEEEIERYKYDDVIENDFSEGVIVSSYSAVISTRITFVILLKLNQNVVHYLSMAFV